MPTKYIHGELQNNYSKRMELTDRSRTDTVEGFKSASPAASWPAATVRAIDQRVNSNTWAYLGLMTVSAAGPVTVKLAPSSTGRVSADAVRALPVTNATTSANNVFTDHLYAPRVITRASDNQMVWRWDNADPFGVGQPDTNPAGLTTTFTYNPRFPGQLYDNETGLHYNYHRTYSPAIGGYTQPDPIGLNGGQLSLYAYVSGNPVNFIDPKGLRELNPSEKFILGGYIPSQDLNNADFHDGEVPWFLPDDKACITLGNDIYCKPDIYKQCTPEGLALNRP